MASPTGRYITLGVESGELQLQYDLGVEGSYSGQPSHTVVDGDWHRLELMFTSDSLNLKLDDTLSYESSSQSNQGINELYQTGSSVYVGGVDSTYRNGDSGMFFSSQNYKGCVNDVRVQNKLLPFFFDDVLGNGTSPSQFVATALTDLRIGCHGDPVCDSDGCLNGAACVDIFNDYRCDCVLGFNGTLCETNIDDCVTNLCENGATCEDGINEYTCTCVPGYTGEWWVHLYLGSRVLAWHGPVPLIAHGICGYNLKFAISISSNHEINFALKFPSDECHRSSLMISQHWLR